ncbi:MAG: FAD-dependent oxidoreductase [Bacteroidetes bacterium]|nr:MAG: FAD-dependent oxidoreductase [Bacteroidota bacterium]
MKTMQMISCWLVLTLCVYGQKTPPYSTQVVIVGGGAGGAAAAIQSARSGAKTLLVESTLWLGGMLTAAGVGCADGNHGLASGIWNQLREAAYKHYGTRNLATGWVSNFNIEPRVGDSILKSFAAAEPNLTIWYNTRLQNVRVTTGAGGVKSINNILVVDERQRSRQVRARVYVDATDLGDLLAAAGGNFWLGLEADAAVGEVVGITQPANIVQDLTYAAILKDFGPGANKTIPKPKGFDPAEFDCACNTYCSNPSKLYSNVNAQKMLDYGKMPNGKYMINWPSRGNDFYSNLVARNASERQKALDSAKQKTLRFVYFIQTTLGFKHLGLAMDEFGTRDGLPFIAYHREGRRGHGLARLSIPHILHPYATERPPLYKTGVSVGDYPIDHHHREYGPTFPAMEFPPVPSYNIPAGSLVSNNVNNLLLADKVISVTNAANGTTRLQPVVMLTGQAAGLMAAQAALQQKLPKALSIRQVQADLLAAGAYIMPFIDVKPSQTNWAAIQRVGASGVLRGVGKPNAWANQTWFYPDSLLNMQQLAVDLGNAGYTSQGIDWSTNISTDALRQFLLSLAGANTAALPQQKPAGTWATRAEAAVLIDHILKPFDKPVDWNGELKMP